MKKLLIPVALIAVLTVAGYVFFERAVRSAIEEGGEYALGVETQLEGVRLGLFDGRVQMDDLEIQNPAGFPEHRLVTIGSIDASVPPQRLLDEVVEVENIALDGVHFRLDIAGLATNVDAILEHLEEVVGPVETFDKLESKRFRIRELSMQNVRAEVNLGSEGLALDLPPIVLRDFDSDEIGMTIPDITALVMHVLVDSAVAASSDGLPPEVSAHLGLLTDNLGLDLGSLTGGATNLGGAAKDALDATLGEEVSGKAQGLLERGVGDLLGGGD